MARLIFELSDEERERLEAHRVRLGKRSLAEVIRHWINSAPEGGMVQAARILEREIGPSASSFAVKPGQYTHVDVQLGPTKRLPGELAKKGKL